MGYIACYIKFRAFVLVSMSFIPPLELIEYKKSWRYPDGHTKVKPYLENSELMLLYTLNILIGSLMICYGVASYYTWSVTQAELLDKNRIDLDNYNRLPKSHLVFILYLLFLALLQYLIDKIQVDAKLLFIRPNYYILIGLLVLELYIACEVYSYVKIVRAQVKDVTPRKEEKDAASN